MVRGAGMEDAALGGAGSEPPGGQPYWWRSIAGQRGSSY